MVKQKKYRLHGRTLTPLQRWEAILEVMRRIGPDNAAAIAREVGLHRTTIVRAIRVGWPEHNLPPLGAEFHSEQEKARAILEEEHEREEANRVPTEVEGEGARIEAAVKVEMERAKARANAARARAEEAQGVEVYRRNALALGTMIAVVTRSMVKLSSHLEAAVAKEAATMKPKEMIAILRSSSRVAKEGAEAMHRAMVLERLLLGEPTNIDKLLIDGEMSPDEAVKWLKRAAKTVDRLDEFGTWGESKLKLVHSVQATRRIDEGPEGSDDADDGEEVEEAAAG